jgi:hypothetical protein
VFIKKKYDAMPPTENSLNEAMWYGQIESCQKYGTLKN